MKNIILNLETADPDDIFTLCFLSHHPEVNLVGITIAPGSMQQVALVKDILHLLDLDKKIPVGVKNPDHPKSCVSEFHNKWLGMERTFTEWEHDGLGQNVIAEAVKNHKNVQVVSGAALSCVSSYLKEHKGQFEEIVVQGGFAGDQVVPEEFQLEKFKGRNTCPSFNLNADIPAALHIIETNQIKKKTFVSKNVCHGVIYDQTMHERIKPHRHNNPGISLLVDGMEFYLKNKPSGKAFHDPLAACVAIEPTVCEFREVQIYREKGEWGSKLRDGTNMFISVSVDRGKFEQILVGK